MNDTGCERSWEVEAIVDGRLDEASAASFERHVIACTICRSERDAHANLVAAMSHLPEETPSDLEHRRARNALLKAANDTLIGSELRPRAWLRFVPIGAAAAASVALALRFVIPSPAAPAIAGVSESLAHFEMLDEGAAQWAKEVDGTTTRVRFREGRARFHVNHLENGARFVVSLPDGDLEVRGTRFLVVVEGGHTNEVTVTEGRVSLDVDDFHGLLEAGQHWTRTPAPPPAPAMEFTEPAPAESAPSANEPAVRASDAETSGAAHPGKIHAIHHASTRALDASTAAPAPPAIDSAPPVAQATAVTIAPGGPFADAVAAFRAGDYGRADSLFGAFCKDFPTDARAEDAAFLRADARARRGDTDGAAVAARDYLQHFPMGLRRPEAQRLAGRPVDAP